MKLEYIMNKSHWQIDSPKDFRPFFSALACLVPEGSILCLGDGDWDETLLSFFKEHALLKPERISLVEFSFGQFLSINQENLNEIIDLAECHAEPEIAAHIAVSHQNRQILEWFDAPLDSISVSLEIPEDNLKLFCNAVGVKYQKVEMSLRLTAST